MMTSLSAILGAMPIALGSGAGAELRQPLGVAVVGGLMVSQLLTLYITPVVYLAMDGVSGWFVSKEQPVPARTADVLPEPEQHDTNPDPNPAGAPRGTPETVAHEKGKGLMTAAE
jgi:hypothetical protein